MVSRPQIIVCCNRQGGGGNSMKLWGLRLLLFVQLVTDIPELLLMVAKHDEPAAKVVCCNRQARGGGVVVKTFWGSYRAFTPNW